MKDNTIKAINLITSLLIENEVLFNAGFNPVDSYYFFSFNDVQFERNTDIAKRVLESDVKDAGCFDYSTIHIKENKLGFQVNVKDR